MAEMKPSEYYAVILEKTRQNQKSLFWQGSQGPKKQDAKESLINEIQNYLAANSLMLEGYSPADLAERLYNDLAEDSILTGPLCDIWVEDILIRKWDDVNVSFINGSLVKIDGFNSPKHAADTVKNLLQKEGLDTTKQVVSGRTKKGDRITAFFQPYVSDDAGVYCTIRKRRQRSFSRQDYVSNDFSSQRELDFLALALRTGLSILIVGLPGTGKTALMEHLLADVTNSVAVEQGYREINTGQSILWPEDSPPAGFIDHVISLNPDVIGFNLETCVAQDAGLQGIPVIAAACSDTANDGLRQAAEQWRGCKTSLDAGTALELTGEVFPIVVTLHRFADRKRRIAGISECSVNGSQIKLKTIWEYEIQGVRDSDGGRVIPGCHRQIAGWSENLIRRIRLNGIDPEKIKLLEMEDSNYAGRESNREAGGRPAASADQEE